MLSPYWLHQFMFPPTEPEWTDILNSNGRDAVTCIEFTLQVRCWNVKAGCMTLKGVCRKVWEGVLWGV